MVGPHSRVSLFLRSPEKLHYGGVNVVRHFQQQQQEFFLSGGRDGCVCCWQAEQTNQEPSALSCIPLHTDWINDVLIMNSDPICSVSCSSDACIRLWHPFNLKSPPVTFRAHKDYVQALCYSSKVRQFASCGLDGLVCIWDPSAQNFSPVSVFVKNKYPSQQSPPISPASRKISSLYSLCCSHDWTLIAGGSSSGIIHMWDPRAGAVRIGKLSSEHNDVVRDTFFMDPLKDSYVSSPMILSCGSDGKMCMWDIRMQRCVTHVQPHQFCGKTPSLNCSSHLTPSHSHQRGSAVWRIISWDSTSQLGKKKGFLTASINGTVAYTPLSHLLCTLPVNSSLPSPSSPKTVLNINSPIMALEGNSQSGLIWTSTRDNTICAWRVHSACSQDVNDLSDSSKDRESSTNAPKDSSDLDYPMESNESSPSNCFVDTSSPLYVIKGKSRIVEIQPLYNRISLLTKDTDGIIELWDVTKVFPFSLFLNKVTRK